ncbi:MAG: 2-hydroxyacyl-CoA dehydratase [Deltaproteobacteria bacterium]|nr:2-hydroxyacyl-CoA dehydratase [Deltaproteobacteria bacterium]
MTAAQVRPFERALAESRNRLRELAATGIGIIGYFCTYTPVELIHAAGFVPVRVTRGSEPVSKADSLVPGFLCPYMRAALDAGLRGEYDFLSGVVQAYTCDAACGTVQIWERSIGGRLFHTMPLPYRDSEQSRKFFGSVIGELIEHMEAAGGQYDEVRLRHSLGVYEEMRRLVLDLYRTRFDGERLFSAADFFSVIQAGFVTPPDEYLGLLRDLIGELGSCLGSAPGGMPVVVSGSVVEDRRLLEILEESGGRVVADDLCTGFRWFHAAAGQGKDPIDRLIDRYMNRFPCPSRARSGDRVALLVELVRRSEAKGVVFLFQKFCTPHLADHPVVVEELKKLDIQSIAVEMEETGLNEGRVRTRLEAFFEMLG